eukprot:jgi/Bigna1/135625/aug1.30_g10333
MKEDLFTGSSEKAMAVRKLPKVLSLAVSQAQLLDFHEESGSEVVPDEEERLVSEDRNTDSMPEGCYKMLKHIKERQYRNKDPLIEKDQSEEENPELRKRADEAGESLVKNDWLFRKMKDKYQGLTIAEKSRLKVIDEIAKLDLDGLGDTPSERRKDENEGFPPSKSTLSENMPDVTGKERLKKGEEVPKFYPTFLVAVRRSSASILIEEVESTIRDTLGYSKWDGISSCQDDDDDDDDDDGNAAERGRNNKDDRS